MTSELTVSRIIRAPRDRVFAAWTDPRLLIKWWGPGPVTCPEAHVDLRPGGEYRLANLEMDGSITWITGSFERVRAPEHLAYTWNVSIVPGDATLVVVDFHDHPQGTVVVITHQRFAIDEVRDMHLQGWGGCLDKLAGMFSAE